MADAFFRLSANCKPLAVFLHKKPTKKNAIELVAVIDIGSSAIRMVVAEMHGPDRWKVIDGADQPIGLGRDVFLAGTITRDSATQTLQILHAFLEQIAGWQIKPGNITVIGTSALREAQNRDMFVDKIALRTGLKISIIEGVEANRLTYIAVRNALRMVRPGFSRANSVIIEVGGGSTEVMLLHAGKMVAAHTLNTGTVRLETEIKAVTGFGGYLERFLRELCVRRWRRLTPSSNSSVSRPLWPSAAMTGWRRVKLAEK